MNEIEGLWVGDNWIEEVEEVKQENLRHFRSQFCANPSSSHQYIPMNFGQNRLEDADNEFLSASFLEDEIKKAI